VSRNAHVIPNGAKRSEESLASLSGKHEAQTKAPGPARAGGTQSGHDGGDGGGGKGDVAGDFGSGGRAVSASQLIITPGRAAWWQRCRPM
jgi:hypothetical protein